MLLEPALASGETYEDLAVQLWKLIVRENNTPGDTVIQEVAGCETWDDVLMSQLLCLCAKGEAPTSVREVNKGEETTVLTRQLPESNPDLRRVTCESVLHSSDASPSAIRDRLLLVGQANAFRSAMDPLGAIAWHALAPKDQRALAAEEPHKMPSPRLWLFLRASLLNHSEVPNAAWRIAGGVMTVRAARKLQAGEEVLLSYWPDIDALDAIHLDLPMAFGMRAEGLGPAPEMHLSDEERKQVAILKGLPQVVAQNLASGSTAAGGDLAALFLDVERSLTQALADMEKALPKNLRAFLEPRCVLAQLTLQQAAAVAARGEAKQAEQLRALSVARVRKALAAFPEPWGQRVLLRLIYMLKGALRPTLTSPPGGSDTDGDFCVQLSATARFTTAELDAELRAAVRSVYGDAALLQAVLSKCGLPA